MKKIPGILVGFIAPFTAFSEEAKTFPDLFWQPVGRSHVILAFQADGAYPSLQKHKGTNLINVEPGCLMIEARCELVDKKTVKITLVDESYGSQATKKLLGIGVSSFLVEFEPTDIPNRMSRILSVKAAEKPSNERDSIRRQ